MSTTLDVIAARGNVRMIGGRYERDHNNRITCADGFSLSVIAGWGCYCSPRPGIWGDVPEDYSGPYHLVEVGFPSTRPEPWLDWASYCESPDDPTSTVYGYAPVDMVQALIDLHGGEA